MPDAPDLESAYALETPEDNQALYREWAGSYDRDFVEATTYRFPRLIAERYVAEGGGWPCLDVGCGTGAVARHLPESAVLDGIDLSPEMLAQARRTGRYRNLVEADLTRTLPLEAGTYAGLVSSGTFTHGHVGPEALAGLVRLLEPGGLAVISVNARLFDSAGFAAELERLARAGEISHPSVLEERIYADPDRAPEGHAADTGLSVLFRKR